MIPVADGTYLGPPAQLLVTRTSLLWMASITLFSARGPFPCGTSQACRGTCIQKRLPELAGTKKFQVDWPVHAHYLGHQSFTKGLLLIDQDAMRSLPRRSEEKWKARRNENWKVLESDRRMKDYLIDDADQCRAHLRW